MFQLRLSAAALLLAAAPAAFAQPPGPKKGPPPGPPPAHLLMHQKSVQDELKLTPPQLAKIHDAVLRTLGSVKPPPPGGKPSDQFLEKMQAMFKEVDQQALAQLEPAQRKRVREIQLQLWGPRAFTDAAVADELKLNDDQRRQMRALLDQATKDQQKVFQSKAQPEVMSKQIAELKKGVTEKTLAVLTSEQRGKWAEMTGKEFHGEVSLPPLGQPLPPPGLKKPPQ